MNLKKRPHLRTQVLASHCAWLILTTAQGKCKNNSTFRMEMIRKNPWKNPKKRTLYTLIYHTSVLGYILQIKKCPAFHHHPATLQWFQHLTHPPELSEEGIAAAHISAPDCSSCHFLVPIPSWEHTNPLWAEQVTPTILPKDQVRVFLVLHNPGDNFHTQPDQQHPQRGIQDEINKVAKSRGKFRFQLCS